MAVIVAFWLVLTTFAVAVKEPIVLPAATVIEEGTVNRLLLEDSWTVAPPAGATFSNVTEQVELPLEMTVVGKQASAVTVIAAGVIVSEATAEVPFSDAVTVTI